jgi:heme exporter protein D
MTEAQSPSPALDAPKPSAAEIRSLVNAERGRAAGLRHIALLLGALTVTGINIALLATEPGLPPRVRGVRAILFALMVAIGSCLSVFAARPLLIRGGMLFGRDKLLAARLAATFALVFTIGMWVVGRWGATGGPGYVWVAAGLAMTAVAVVIMLRAKRRLDELKRRRAELERTLGGVRQGRTT